MVLAESPLWGEQRVRLGDRHRRWSIGSLCLWVSRTSDELRIASRHRETGDEPCGVSEKESEEELEWTRWTLQNDHFAVQLTPVFSTIPLVVRPESSFQVARNCKVRIYIQVPVWVRVELVLPDRTIVAAELPSVVLSKSWSGTFTEGELCYWIATAAPREVDSTLYQPHLAICPVEIQNDSEEELRVETLCLRVMHLSLYGFGDRLWSDEARVSFTGEEKESEIEVLGKPPPESGEARLLSPPRSPVESTFAAKTFSRLKQIPGFGMIT